MAISPQKLLPQSGSTGVRLSSSLVKTSNLGIARRPIASNQDIQASSGGKLVLISDTLLNINNILSQRVKENNEQVKQRKSVEDKKEKQKEEKELELKPQKNKINLPKIQTPFASFFDRLKNALVLLFVGWLVNTFFEYIPKILEGVSNFMKTLEDIRRFLKPAMDALGSALYNVTLVGTKTLGALTGASIDKNEKDLAVAINELDKKFSIVNALMVGVVIGDIFSAVADGLDLFERPGRIPPVDSKKIPKVAQQRYYQRFGRNAFIRKFGEEAVQNLPRNLQRGFVQRGARNAGAISLRGARNVFGRGAVKVAGKVFGRIPIIGGLIDFVINLAMGEKPGRAAAKAIGATVGAGLGTLIPIPFAGTILGGFLGDLLGGAVYDMFANKPTSKKGPKKKTEKPKGYFLGGLVSGVRGFFSGKPKPITTTSRGLSSSQKAIQQQGITPSTAAVGRITADPQLTDRIGEKLFSGFTEVANLISSGAAGVGPFVALGITLALGRDRFTKSNALGIASGIGNLLGSPLVISIYNFLDKSMPGLGRLVQKVVGRDFGVFLSNSITQLLGRALYVALSPLQGLIKLIMFEASEQAKEVASATAGDGAGGGATGGGMLPGDAPPEVKAMLEAIAGGEGSWNSVNPSTNVPELSNMTIADARRKALQVAAERNGSGAMGKWQQMPQYIIGRAKSAGLDPDKDKFNQENQTKIARMLMAGVYPGGEKQLVKDVQSNGPLFAASKLRGTWPSLPGGTQENVHSKGFVSRFQENIKKYQSAGIGGGIFKENNLKAADIKPSKPSSISAMAYPGVSNFASYDRPSTQLQVVRQIVYVPMNKQQSGGGGVVMMGGGGVNNIDYQIAATKAAL
jgi:hypothetical protein